MLHGSVSFDIIQTLYGLSKIYAHYNANQDDQMRDLCLSPRLPERLSYINVAHLYSANNFLRERGRLHTAESSKDTYIAQSGKD